MKPTRTIAMITVSVLIVMMFLVQSAPFPIETVEAGSTTHVQVVRASTRAQVVGHKEYYNKTFTVGSGWDTSNLFAAVFVQDQAVTTKSIGGYTLKSSEVLQATMDDLSGKVTDTGTGRRVLFELGTGEWCGYCPGADGAFDRIVDNSAYFPTKCVPITWHNGDTYANSDGNSRLTAYGISGYPTAYFDGVDMKVGGAADPDSTALDATYKNKIDTRYAVASPIKITTFGSVGSSNGWINATIEFTAVPTISNMYVYIVIVEDLATTYTHGSYVVPLRHTGRKIILKQSLTVPNDPPTISLTSDFSSQELQGFANITWTASDPEQVDSSLPINIEYNQDGGAWHSLTSLSNKGFYMWNTSNMADGTGYNIRVTVTDIISQSATAAGTGTFSIDNPNYPVVGLTTPADSGVYGTFVPVAWTATDDEDGSTLSIDISYLDVATLTWSDVVTGITNTGSYEWNVSALTDGYYRVSVKATDSDLMSTSASNGKSFYINNPEPPYIAITHPTAGATLSGDHTITWDSSDPEDASTDLKVTIELQQDGGEWTTLADSIWNVGYWSFDTTSVPDSSSCKLRITIVDSDSMSAVTESDTFSIHNPDAPVLTTDSFDSEVKTANWNITWAATDADGDTLAITLQYSPDGSLWEDIATDEVNDGIYSFDTTLIPDGFYYFKITATDDSTDTLSTSVHSSSPMQIYNPDAPVVLFQNLQEGKEISGTFDVRWDAMDGDNDAISSDLYYSYDNTTWTELETDLDVFYYSVDTTELDNGDIYFKVVVTDSSTLALSSQAISVRLVVSNNLAPTIALGSPADGSTVSGTVDITWTATDPNSDDLFITIYIGGNVVTYDQPNDGSYSWDSSSLMNSDYTISIKVSDGTLSATDSVSITVANAVTHEPTNTGNENDTTNGTTSGSSSSSLGAAGFAAIIVVIIVVLLAIIIAAVVVVLFIVKKKNAEKRNEAQTPPPPSSGAPAPAYGEEATQGSSDGASTPPPPPAYGANAQPPAPPAYGANAQPPAPPAYGANAQPLAPGAASAYDATALAGDTPATAQPALGPAPAEALYTEQAQQPPQQPPAGPY